MLKLGGGGAASLQSKLSYNGLHYVEEYRALRCICIDDRGMRHIQKVNTVNYFLGDEIITIYLCRAYSLH